MKNPNPNSTLFVFLFFALLAFSHIARVESICAKRNFEYPCPNKPITSGSPPKAEQPSLQSSSSPSSSSKEENESSLSPASSQKSSSSSASVSGSASGSGSGAVDSPDGGSELKSKFGDMLKSVVGQIDPNSPILNIPKASVNDPDIKKMCGATDFPDLCESTVSHFVDGRHDPVAMLDFVIKACVQYTQLAMATAKKISEAPSFSKIKARFKDITDYYVDALENLQDAENAIKVKDIATVNINLSAALDDFGAYEDDWGEKSPMADFDAKLTHMASNCLAVANLVKFH